MIEIKCNEREKEIIIGELSRTVVMCVFEYGTCECNDCRECLDKRIKWTIRGNEDAE